MTITMTVLGGLTSTAFAAAIAHATNPAEPILWTAAVLTALGVIYRLLHLGEIVRGLLLIVRQWHGEKGAPGIPARMSIPEIIDYQSKQLHEIKGRDAQLVVALEQLAQSANDNGVKIDRLDERVIGLDERVTDHRRRNEDQARVLREELERRAADLEAKLLQRNEVVDARLADLSDDLLRAETMRAALVELGLDVEPPQR